MSYFQNQNVEPVAVTRSFGKQIMSYSATNHYKNFDSSITMKNVQMENVITV